MGLTTAMMAPTSRIPDGEFGTGLGDLVSVGLFI